MFWEALWKGHACGEELRPSDNNHMSKPSSPQIHNPSQAFRDCGPCCHLECSLLKKPLARITPLSCSRIADPKKFHYGGEPGQSHTHLMSTPLAPLNRGTRTVTLSTLRAQPTTAPNSSAQHWALPACWTQPVASPRQGLHPIAEYGGCHASQ